MAHKKVIENTILVFNPDNPGVVHFLVKGASTTLCGLPSHKTVTYLPTELPVEPDVAVQYSPIPPACSICYQAKAGTTSPVSSGYIKIEKAP